MSYKMKFWLLAGLAFGSAMVLGIVIGKTVPASGGVENPALILPFLLAAIVPVALAVWLWWRKTDDIQQQGQMISWWWGGNLGALVMLVCLVVVTGRHSDLSLGAGFMFMAQFVGFFAVWLGWKFRGRGPVE